MIGAFSSELVKLRRPSLLGWGLGGGLFFAMLATIFTIERAQRTLSPFGGHRGRVTFATLEQPNGLVHGVVDISPLIGIVALALFAGAFATEYSQGTMRNLLVREPRRVQLICGKFLALVLFIAFAVLLEVIAAGVLAFILAPGRGIATGAWTSSTGITDLLQALLHVFLASVGYGVFGAALGILLRSPGVAIGVGVAYILPGEAIIAGAIWSNGDHWLPGRLLDALARGGNGSSSYEHALLMVAIYAAVAGAATLWRFATHDA